MGIMTEMRQVQRPAWPEGHPALGSACVALDMSLFLCEPLFSPIEQRRVGPPSDIHIRIISHQIPQTNKYKMQIQEWEVIGQ